MDLVIYAPGAANPIYVDISIASALSAEALAGGSAARDGRAAEIAERRKHAAYPLIGVTPCIIEDHGRIGEEALTLIRRIAPASLTDRAVAIRELYQRMSATLQRIASDAVLSAVASPHRSGTR